MNNPILIVGGAGYIGSHMVKLRLAAGGDSDAFNLGNGNGFSVREVIEAAQRVSGRE